MKDNQFCKPRKSSAFPDVTTCLLPPSVSLNHLKATHTLMPKGKALLKAGKPNEPFEIVFSDRPENCSETVQVPSEGEEVFGQMQLLRLLSNGMMSDCLI